MKLRIDKPCNENWDEMSLKEKGRFCKACDTLVLDMTQYTDTQIIEFFKEKTYNVCGQFSEIQLGRELVPNVVTKSTSLKKYMVAASLVGTVFGASYANTSPDANHIENILDDQKPPKDNGNKKKANFGEKVKFVINGKVIDGNGKAAEGAEIRVNKEIVLTDKNGVFQITLSADETEILDVNLHINQEGMEYKIVTIHLDLDKTLVDLGKIKLNRQNYHRKGKVAIDR